MADYQRVVEFLRDLRQAPLQAVTEEIAQSAKDYALLCEEANERLRQCSAFLQQGLRSEALHLADETPNLLDVVAALDLPDPAQWAEFCANNGLPIPPPLALDRAGQINEAYAQDQPMEHLLAEHRLLALSRAPVKKRLNVMRQLSALDAGNVTWEKDIRIFERARIKELPTTFLAAVRERDEQGIRDLMGELTQTAWYEPPPEDLVNALSDAYARIQRANVEAELHELIPSLRDAYAAQSVKECQGIVQRWKNIMTAGGVGTVSRELTDEIKPVIAWIAEEERKEERLRKFRSSCKVFGDMLDQDVRDRELEAGYAKLKEFGEPIPDDLTERYTAKKVLRQKATERSHKLWLAVVGATVVVIIAITAGGLLYFAHVSAAGAWARKIQKANTERNLVLARQYITEQERSAPRVSGDPAVAAAKKETEALEFEYNQALGFAKELLALFDRLEKTYAPVAANTSASVPEMLLAAQSLQDGLDEARSKGDLSWVDPDKKLASAEVRVNSILAALRTHASAGVKTLITTLTDEMAALPTTAEAIPDTMQKLNAATLKLRAAQEMAGLDDETKGLAAAAITKIDKIREGLGTARDMAAELQNVRIAATSADDLKKALERFASHFPNAPQTPDFTTAIAHTPQAKSYEAWRDLINTFDKRFAPASAAIAQKRLDAITAFITANPDSPMIAAATTYSDYLKRAADALAEKGTWQTAFGDLLTTPMVSELCYMEDTTGKRYYTLGDIKLKPGRINNQINMVFEALNPKDLTKRINITIDPPVKLLNDNKPVRVPHAKFAAEMIDAIKMIDESNWDTYGIDLTDKLNKATDMEVVVKAILMQQTLKTNELVAGWAIGDIYSKAETELGRQKPEDIQWVDPEKVTDGTRKSLKATLDSVPSSAVVKQLLAAKKEALQKSASPEIMGTGVLLKDGQGNWELTPHAGLINGNVAWIVVANAIAGMPSTLTQIGTVVEGKFVLSEPALKDIPQGTLVFITKP